MFSAPEIVLQQQNRLIKISIQSTFILISAWEAECRRWPSFSGSERPNKTSAAKIQSKLAKM